MAQPRTRPLLTDVIRSELRRAIISGEFPPGSKLPNEESLCEKYAVSRITLREAVRGLIEEGYVLRRQGAGTFVTSGPALRNSLDINFSYTEYLESAGVKVSKKILAAEVVSGDPQVLSDLQLGAHEKLVVVRRVRVADKRPAIYSVDSVPAGIVDLKKDMKALKGSMYGLLAARGQAVDHARTVITPVVASDELSAILEVPKGTPLQHLTQIDYVSSGRPIMHSLEWHVPSVIELRVFRRGPGPVSE
ncbi:MAG: GntR family transcriptional regulator [Hyphomicrobiaceae bacterium]|nr:GntR family transcriptional regulator [Hyphomicrobiaceae bacterium]